MSVTRTMPKQKGFNGFKNWETWNVNLWLYNDHDYYNGMAGLKTARELREFVEGVWSVENKFGDITTKEELARVDWTELAELIND